MKLFVSSLGLLVLILSACTPQSQMTKVGSIEIVNPYMRAALSGGNTGAFMLIKNTGNEVDKLIKAEFADAMDTEIHETKMVDDIMRMEPVEAVELPANGQVELKPGGYHVMMMGLMKELRDGEKVNVTLTFDKAGSVTVPMVVRNP